MEKADISTLEKPDISIWVLHALWSIRGIMSSEIRVFPTLLDAWILTLCVVLIVLLTWKVTFRALGKE